MSETNRSFPMGMNYEQGIGFSENTGAWPMPEARTGVIKITDENDYQHVLVLDYTDGKFYNISMREGPTNSGLVEHFKDKVDVDGTGGTDISPEVTFKEDTGEYEKYTTEHLGSRYYVRPGKETNRNGSGYDSNGYMTGTEFSSYIYVDGEPTTETAYAEDISKAGEIVYDRKVEGRRLQSKFTSNRSDFQLVARQQTYITKDINYDYENRVTTEGDHQENLSSPLLWISRWENPTIDIIGGSGITGDASYQTGPDERSNSAFSISSAISTPSVTSTDAKTLFMWVSGGGSGVASVAVGGNSITMTNYSSSGNWYCNYASGITHSGQISITPSGTIGVFDIRLMSGDKSSDLSYYFGDVTRNGADNVCLGF